MPERSFSSRREWRDWLEQNHARISAVWLVYYKVHTGTPSITYRESLEEALCYGWIDGVRRSIDDEKYAIRFTPRRSGSKWSVFNMNLAGELIEAGRMAEAGLKIFHQRVEQIRNQEARQDRELSLSPELEETLRKNEKAWRNFLNLAPSYRKQYMGWLMSAKRPETRRRRLEEAMRLLEDNQKLGMK